MSSIDQYIYTCLGVIECPMPYRYFSQQANIQPIQVAIYRLRQDISEFETDFQGSEGDILVGGGGGEAPAMRIRMPEAMLLYTNWNRFEQEYPDLLIDELYSTYWSPTQAFMLCTGYETLGWNPENDRIEQWLMEHVVSFLVKHFADDYKQFIGNDTLDCDGKICHTLTDEEDRIWNWKTHKYGI